MNFLAKRYTIFLSEEKSSDENSRESFYTDKFSGKNINREITRKLELFRVSINPLKNRC